MKSIEDTLRIIDDIVKSLNRYDRINNVLVGVYASIAHGVERTTADVDFCIYSEVIHKKDTANFFELLKRVIPVNFEITYTEGSKILDDPFKHDVIFIYDKLGEYPKIDLIIAKYKWELEGIESAKLLEDIPFPVLPKPHLIAMKLRAGSLKDDYDIVELYKLLTEEEKNKTHQLAKLIHRDKKLARLIKPPQVRLEKEDRNLLI